MSKFRIGDEAALLRTIPPSISLAAKIGVGSALLILVLMRVPLDGVLVAFSQLRPVDVALAVVLYFAAHGVNALKLRLLLPQLSVRQALRFTMIAVLYGTALPGQLAGDAVKAFRLTRAASRAGDVSATISAVTIDKVLGLFALLALTAVGLGLDAAVFGASAVKVVGIGLTAFIILLALVVAAPVPAFLQKWTVKFSAWRRLTLRPSTLLQSLLLGVVFQGLSIIVFAVLGTALGLELSIASWAVVVGLVSVVLLLPVTIAGVGLRDGSLVGLIALLGQSQSAALALSLTLLALNILGAAVGLLADLAGNDQDA